MTLAISPGLRTGAAIGVIANDGAAASIGCSNTLRRRARRRIEEDRDPGNRGRDFPEQFKPFAREAATSVGEAVALPPGRA